MLSKALIILITIATMKANAVTGSDTADIVANTNQIDKVASDFATMNKAMGAYVKSHGGKFDQPTREAFFAAQIEATPAGSKKDFMNCVHAVFQKNPPKGFDLDSMKLFNSMESEMGDISAQIKTDQDNRVNVDDSRLSSIIDNASANAIQKSGLAQTRSAGLSNVERMDAMKDMMKGFAGNLLSCAKENDQPGQVVYEKLKSKVVTSLQTQLLNTSIDLPGGNGLHYKDAVDSAPATK